jgi:ribosomal protein L25 (general stress protein Ctc)
MPSRIEMEGARREPVAEVTDLDRDKMARDLHRIKEISEVLDLTQGHSKRLLMVQMVQLHSFRT